MPRRSLYEHYTLNKKSLPTEHVTEVNDFRGVDYNKSQLKVSNNHAVDILNIIRKDKVNQKRKGWSQIFKVEPVTYYIKNEDGTRTLKTNGTNFNAIWTFIAENNKQYVIAHIGNILFEVENIGKNYTFLDATFNAITYTETDSSVVYHIAKELNDMKTNAFANNGRLYILGGNKYYVLKVVNNVLVLNEVENDEDTYIPTTVIGITEKDASVSGRTPLDDVNLLTEWRKNKLVTGAYVDDGVSLRTTRYPDFELDSGVRCKNPTDINNIKIEISSLREV